MNKEKTQCYECYWNYCCPDAGLIEKCEDFYNLNDGKAAEEEYRADLRQRGADYQRIIDEMNGELKE